MRKASKNRAHHDDCRAQGISFQPLVVESFGGWDKEATKFLKEMARLDARRWGKNDALKIKHFFQRLLALFFRFNVSFLKFIASFLNLNVRVYFTTIQCEISRCNR